MADFYNLKLFCSLCDMTIYENKIHLDDGETYDLPSGGTIESKYFREVGWCLDCKGDKLIYAPYPITKASNEIAKLQYKLNRITSSWTFRMFGWLMVEAQAKSKRIQKKIQKFRSIIDFAKSKSDYERQYCAVCGSTNIVPLTKETKSIDLITHLCGEPVSCEVDTGDYAWNNE